MTKKIPTVIGIIPARAGSKGIPGKNLKMIAGKPLVTYAIEAARGSKYLTRCIVSTESKEIADVCRDAGADVPFVRPADLATDAATAMTVMQHALQWLRENDSQQYDYVAYLQPTSPLRTSADIDACIIMAMECNADSVFSMKEIPDFAPEKLKILEDGRIQPLLRDEKKESSPREKGPAVYKRNCAVYLTRTSLLEKGDLFGKNSFGYVMPEERSIDINTPADLALTEFWLKKAQ